MDSTLWVFISYSHKDTDTVKRLQSALHVHGVNVWLDHEKLIPGTPNWGKAIQEGIRASQFLIYVASVEANASDYVNEEIHRAKDLGIPIIPFWITGIRWLDVAPMGVGLTQFIDAREPRYDTALLQLYERLGVAEEPRQAVTPAPPIVPVLAESPSAPVNTLTFSSPPSSANKSLVHSPWFLALTIALATIVIVASAAVIARRNGSTTTSHGTSLSTATTGSGTSDACAGGRPIPNSSTSLVTPNFSALGSTHIHLYIALIINSQAFSTCLGSIYDPTSVNYRKFLNPDDFAQRFTLSDADVNKVKQYLTSQGLTVSQTYNTNAALTVDGTASAAQNAFNASTFPSNIQGLIAGIIGANPTTLLQCMVTGVCGYITHAGSPIIPPGAKYQVPAQPTSPKATSIGDCTFAATGTPIDGGGTGNLLTWSDLRHAYGLDKLAEQGYDGGSTSIGMVEFDPYSRQDVVNYMECAGTYDPNRLTNVDVVPGLQPSAGIGEATLDVEMAAGLTGKNTKIVTYNAPNNAQWQPELLDIFQRVASDKQVSVLSVGYGDSEQDLGTIYLAAVNITLAILAAEGISVFVASGDCGAFGAGQFGTQAVNFPASDPWAIGVGGTDLSVDPTTGSRTSEQVWGNSSPDKTTCKNTWGSGGGLSADRSFTIPSWQKGPGIINTSSTGARQVPDVAAAAINISIYYSSAVPGAGGLWVMTGGTSAAAPIWAAGIDVVDQALAAKGKPPMGGVPIIYQLANSSNSSRIFNDITKGNNGYFQATPGWDFTTGWGSPNFDQIAAGLGA